MGTTVLKTLLPKGNTFAIESPCNGGTVAQYARIALVDGLNDAYSEISAINRVGYDGAMYGGKTRTMKEITVTVDLSDARITWSDVYSFFNKSVLYVLRWNAYYIKAVIRKWQFPFFNNRQKTAVVSFECNAPYWSRDIGATVSFTVSGANKTTFRTTDIFGVGETAPSFIIRIGAITDQSVTGLRVAPVGVTDEKYIYNVAFLSMMVPLEGVAITWQPNKDAYMSFDGRAMKVSGYPARNKRLILNDDYEFSLEQSELNTGVTIDLTYSGTLRADI